jgi:hypothetical protein
MISVRLAGIGRGDRPVSMIRAIKEHSTGSLKEAKNRFDRFMAGEEVILEFTSLERRDAFRAAAHECGFVVDRVSP